MLDVINNIDPINYIIQDVLKNITGMTLVPRNNFYTGDGYALDVQEVRKNSYKLKIRTPNLQVLCNIGITKKEMVIRYSPDFFFVQKGQNLNTNLFEDTFTVNELQEAFEKNSTAFGLPVRFEYSTMQETIEACRRVHDEFLRSIDAS